MDLSVSIVNWNTRDLLDQCLDSVYATIGGLDAEVIVVDNASTDGSVEMVRNEYPRVILIENKTNVGFAAANNQALAISKGRHFLLLNPDTICHPDALNRLVCFLDEHPRCGAVGPLVLNEDGTLQHSWAKFPTVWSETIGKLDRSTPGQTHPPATAEEARALKPFRTDWAGGCCLMVKREAIEQIGPMDESLFMYCEETDWCLRLQKAGWEVWVEPRAEITHYGGKSSEQVSSKCALALRRSKTIFFAKHFGRVQAVLVAIACALRSILRRGKRPTDRTVYEIPSEMEPLSILELGCGKRREYSDSITVDICAESNPDVLHDLNQYPYPFADNSFDVVICNHILEHLDDVVRTLEEIHRILKPGGLLKVEAPYFTSVYAYADPTHKHFFTSRSFDYFFEGTELSRFDYSRVRYAPKKIELVVPGNGILSRLARRWLESHLDFYEKRLAYIWPRHTIRYELTAVK
ncbi:MAG: glycosyltransferase [Armatimonadetes bacterium]|nr:glycosyltransferase [Armatimonadota bacterium]